MKSNNLNKYRALFAIANIYIKKGNYNEAQKYTDCILKIDESNEDAIQLLITIFNSKKNNEYTVNYLEEIIEKQPLSFKLIEIYIDILRRMGR